MNIRVSDTIGDYYFQRNIYKENQPSDGCVVTLFPDGEIDVHYHGWSTANDSIIRDYGISQALKWMSDLDHHLRNLENENVTIKSGVYHFIQKPKSIL